MQTWIRRLRGAGGMGLIWAVAWSAAGAVLARIPGFYSDLPFPILFAPLGFLTGVLFSGVIAMIEGGRERGRISVPRFAGWGAAGGLLLTGAFVVGAALGGRSVWAEFLTFGPALVIAGAASAAGTLAMARWADRRDLPAGGDAPPDIPRPEGAGRAVSGRGD